jgi:hypothetical protein
MGSWHDGVVLRPERRDEAGEGMVVRISAEDTLRVALVGEAPLGGVAPRVTPGLEVCAVKLRRGVAHKGLRFGWGFAPERFALKEMEARESCTEEFCACQSRKSVALEKVAVGKELELKSRRAALRLRGLSLRLEARLDLDDSTAPARNVCWLAHLPFRLRSCLLCGLLMCR